MIIIINEFLIIWAEAVIIHFTAEPQPFEYSPLSHLLGR
jgi:hypothetical protein